MPYMVATGNRMFVWALKTWTRAQEMSVTTCNPIWYSKTNKQRNVQVGNTINSKRPDFTYATWAKAMDMAQLFYFSVAFTPSVKLAGAHNYFIFKYINVKLTKDIWVYPAAEANCQSNPIGCMLDTWWWLIFCSQHISNCLLVLGFKLLTKD